MYRHWRSWVKFKINFNWLEICASLKIPKSCRLRRDSIAANPTVIEINSSVQLNIVCLLLLLSLARRSSSSPVTVQMRENKSKQENWRQRKNPLGERHVVCGRAEGKSEFSLVANRSLFFNRHWSSSQHWRDEQDRTMTLISLMMLKLTGFKFFSRLLRQWWCSDHFPLILSSANGALNW